MQAVLTGPLIGATLALPSALATSVLQQHVTAALRGQQTGSLLASRPFNVVSIFHWLHIAFKCIGKNDFDIVYLFIIQLRC